MKTYPGGRRPLDAGQLALLAAFNARLHPTWSRRLEVVVPIEGDLRAADEVIRTDACSCSVEAITRLADLQRQTRSGRAKQRDLKADRLILVVKGSHANRRLLRAAGRIVDDAFPIRRAKRFARSVSARIPAATAWSSSDPGRNLRDEQWMGSRACSAAACPSVLRLSTHRPRKATG